MTPVEKTADKPAPAVDPAAAKYDVVSDIYVDTQHFAPRAQAELTAAQADALGAAIKPAKKSA